MKIEFPDLKGRESSTLYIIGNGFDLFHGLESKYEDFYFWLNANNHKEFSRNIQKVFPKLDTNPNFLWSNFEDAMAEYDLNKLYEVFYVEPENHIWAPEEWKKTADKINSICKDLRPLMKEWAAEIPTNEATPKLSLSKESWYLTFNYTMLLEDVYDIPKDHICHIHGCAKTDDTILVGHDRQVSVEHIYSDGIEDEYSKREIAKVMNGFVKKKDKMIASNQVFFDSIKKVSHVVVLGHSLSGIDLLYFFRVLNIIQPNSNWHFSKHQGCDENNIDVFVRHDSDNQKRIANHWIFNF